MAWTPESRRRRAEELAEERETRALTAEELQELAGHYRALGEADLARQALAAATGLASGGAAAESTEAVEPPRSSIREEQPLTPAPLRGEAVRLATILRVAVQALLTE